MNAELLAMLGGGAPPAAVRREEAKSLLSFKAGKMMAELQPNGKYMISADQRRGTLDLNYTKPTPPSSNGTLKLEWKDRRTNATVDSLTIFAEDGLTYQKVDTGREGDRVYLLEYGSTSNRRYFFWMQDKLEGTLDEDNCVLLNTYLTDPKAAEEKVNGEGEESAEPASGSPSGGMRLDMNGLGSGGMDNAALMQIMSNLGPNGTASAREGDSSAASGGDAAAPQGQVDALSNILENLGMPQPNVPVSESTATAGASTDAVASSAPDAVTSSTSSTATPAAAAPASSGLTLSDLQGAMAGLATTSPTNLQPLNPTPPLNELVTPASISTVILSDEAVKSKLVSLLPEGQQTTEYLEENLRSPQVAQCLKSLSAALADEGMEGFHSILANFQLDPKDGQEALVGGNPIQAFLDCVLKSVEREKSTEEEAKEGKSDGDEEMKE